MMRNNVFDYFRFVFYHKITGNTDFWTVEQVKGEVKRRHCLKEFFSGVFVGIFFGKPTGFRVRNSRGNIARSLCKI